jgi:hypothetical protein
VCELLAAINRHAHAMQERGVEVLYQEMKKWHIDNIFNKPNVKNRIKALQYANTQYK